MKIYRAGIVGCGWRSTGTYKDAEDSYLSIHPRSHAQGFIDCDRTDLVAASDFRQESLDRVNRDYGIDHDHLYTDFHDMIEKENLDILSIGTQQEQRAAITIYAANAGIRAIYAEKPLTSSTEEADSMLEAIEQNEVAFNLGANRRWFPGYEIVRNLANSGKYGALKTIITYNMNPIFISGSHWFDLINWINCDRPAISVQGSLTNGGDNFDGEFMTVDPGGHCIIQYENEVTAYCLTTPRGAEQEVICEGATFSITENGDKWQIRELGQDASRDSNTRLASRGNMVEFPEFEPISTTKAIIEELVKALDTKKLSTRGGIKQARASNELIFALMESHRTGGQPVSIPLNSSIKLKRDFDPKGQNHRPGKLRKVKGGWI